MLDWYEICSTVILVGPFFIFIFALIAFVIQNRRKYSFWSSRGVKSPPIFPPFGNLVQRFIWAREHLEPFWARKYGKLYGQYIGFRPDLTVADPEIVTRICIKDFNNFVNHQTNQMRFQTETVFSLKDDRWRQVRAIMSPTFSTGRIKSMYEGFVDGAHEAIDRIESQIGSSGLSDRVDTKKVFSEAALTVALRCFYGINLNKATEGRTKEDLKTIQTISRMGVELFTLNIVRIGFALILPLWFQKLIKFSAGRVDISKFFYNQSIQIVERRRKDPNKHKYADYLDLLIKAEAGNGKSRNEQSEISEQTREKHFVDQGETQQDSFKGQDPSRGKLTDGEIYSQVMLFMLVSAGTTTEVLVNICYILAHHNDVQQKLRDEILKIRDIQPDGSYKLSAEAITSCEYLDCVVSESLRNLPVILEMDRVANDHYFIGEPYNIQIPKGTVVKLAYYTIHHDPDYWPEPDKFIPERFSRENKPKIVPGSYLPFGQGPRFCIAFRFALAEVKIFIAHIISRYEILKIDGTTYPPEPNKMSLLIASYKNTDVKFRKLKL